MDSPSNEQDRWFAEHLRPHEASLRAYLMRSLGSAADVDDVLQESYFRVWKARSSVEIRSAKNFLFTVARNAIRDMLRRRKVADEVPFTETAPLAVLEDGQGVTDQVSRRQELDVLAEAIASLPVRCREVFLLRKIQGLPQREIARLLDISENTVETQVARGARACADYVQARCATHTNGRGLNHGA
jgi:RNA polymerase sigma-70 factor (ECF subfamily)